MWREPTDRTEVSPAPPASALSIRWYRWVGLLALVAAIVSFLSAAIAEVTASGTPSTRVLFWTAVTLNLFCLVALPVLLFRAIRFRGLVRKQWRLVLMRAVWGGPFGTLGALWDLCAEPPAAADEQTFTEPTA